MHVTQITQGDLFAVDSPLLGDIMGERTVAEFPFFALKKTKQVEPMIFSADGVTIELSAGRYGIATIYDKEILLYVASIITDLLDRGGTPGRTIRFTAHDLFRITGTNVGARSYTYLIDALRRLRGTVVETNIATGGEETETNFSWLDQFKVAYAKDAKGERRVKFIEVTVCDWFFRAVQRDRRLAAYDLGYFSLSPIERRLYELAMFNCHGGTTFRLELTDVAERMGCGTGRLRATRAEITRISEQDTLPEYSIALVSQKVPSSVPRAGRKKLQTFVTFTARSTTKKRVLSPEMMLDMSEDDRTSRDLADLTVYVDEPDPRA